MYKNRFDVVNEIYHPYVKKHLGDNSLQNILVTGGSFEAVYVEVDRHRHLNYENIFHFEIQEFERKLVEEPVGNRFKVKDYKQVFKGDIFSPDTYVQSVNLIYADSEPRLSKVNKVDWSVWIEERVLKLLDNGFIDNELGVLVFLFFGVDIESFLDKQYGEYKSKDFFSSNIVWDDGYGIGDQRLDCVVFFL